MIYILCSAICYSVAFISHVFLHRYLLKNGKTSFRTVFIFLFFLFILVFIVFSLLPGPDANTFGRESLQVTSIVLFFLLSWLHTIFYTESFYVDKGPSRTIRAALGKKPLTEKQILSLFSNDVLISRRVYHLEEDGMIEQEKGLWRTTKKGRLVHTYIEKYRDLMKWRSSG